MNFKKFITHVPSEYQELTAIANLGTQYINTGLKGSDLEGCELEIVMKNDTTITTAYNFNGTYVSGSAAQFGLVATSSSECRASINFGFTTAISLTGLNLSDFHTIYATNGLQKVDNTVVGTLNFGTLNDNNFLLFARTDINESSGINICAGMSLKSFTVKRNNQYIRNMIPVMRKSDNQIGLYDLANNVFYTNQGTDDFIAGDVADTWLDSHYIRVNGAWQPVASAHEAECTVNIYDKYNILDIPNLGIRYGVECALSTYSIYNNTNNSVIWGTNDWASRHIACEPHSTATVTIQGIGVSGFIMPYNDDSLGEITIVQGSTVPDHYIPYIDWD